MGAAPQPPKMLAQTSVSVCRAKNSIIEAAVAVLVMKPAPVAKFAKTGVASVAATPMTSVKPTRSAKDSPASVAAGVTSNAAMG